MLLYFLLFIMKPLIAVVAVLAAVSAQFSYVGYKVYQVIPKTEEEFRLLEVLKYEPDYDFWSQLRELGVPVSIMISPDTQKAFTNMLELNGIEYAVLIDNVEETITAERSARSIIPKVNKGDINFLDYHRLEEIEAYLERLAAEYPDIVKLEDIGYSYEDRKLRIIKISTGGKDKPIMFIEGGIHAREWISPAVVLYIIQQLVEIKENRDLIENTDWYLIPSMNPDGYEYSHTVKRMWRKTRSKGNQCFGVDANRNFNYKWNTVGASSDECSNTYAGPNAFSENETVAIRKVVSEYKDNIKFYLSVHSHGNYLLYPWAYTSDLPPDADKLQSLGESAANALKSVHETIYTVGSSANALYECSGISTDWAKGANNIDIAYVIELPGGGSAGFDLPPNRIQGVCEETWEAVVVYQKYIEKKFT